MFARAYTVFCLMLVLPLLAAATPAPLVARTDTPAAPTCTTGSAQCCNQTQTASQVAAGPLGVILGLLGVVLGEVTGLVGIGCSPISVVGVGGGNCNANAVCCQNNNVGGLISVGCIPIIL